MKDRIVRPEGEARVAHIVFASSLIDLMFSTKSGAASAWTIHGCIGKCVCVNDGERTFLLSLSCWCRRTTNTLKSVRSASVSVYLYL